MNENNRESINPFKDDITGRLLLGRYRVVRRLAAGGMGVVYLARLEGAAGFVKPVVVKLVLPILQSNAEFSGMFAREAHILADLQHPGIVGIIEFAEELNCNIMVLEYVNGFSLGDWKRFLASKQRMVPTDVAIQIAINTLDALHYAHTLKNHKGESMRIIHRDISPGNIMLDVEGHIKLVDFGIALVSEANEGFRTVDRSFKGKLAYSSPELFTSGKAGPKSDVYAVGITLHETLVGKNEFNQKDHAKVIHAVLNHVPSSVHAVRDDAPEAVDEVLWKSLAKKPEHRYDSALEFASALREISLVPEHKSLALLAELVKQDFGEEMSRFLNVESLASRERAWRFPSMVPSVYPAKAAASGEQTDDPTKIHSEIKTRVVKPEGILKMEYLESLSGPRHRFLKWMWIVPVVLLITAAAAIAFVWTERGAKPDNRRFLLVQSEIPDDVEPAGLLPKENVPENTAPKSIPAPDEKKEPVVEKTPAAPKIAGVNKTPPDEVKLLTAAFKKRKNEIQACFEANPSDMEGDPTLFVSFTVSASGRVESADLTPQAMAGKPLGRCLLTVSRSTVFPKRKDPVSFRIPVSARRVER